MKITKLEKIILNNMIDIVRGCGNLDSYISPERLISLEVAPENDFKVCFQSLCEKGYIEKKIINEARDCAYKLKASGIDFAELG